MPRGRSVGTAVWILCACACAGAAEDDAAEQDPDAGPGISEAVVEGSFRGFAVFDVDGRPRFEPCGPTAAPALELADSSGGDLLAAYQELVGEPGGRLFVEVRGRVEPVERRALESGPARRLVTEEVRRASLNQQGCDEDLDGLLYRATGNEPFWSVDVSPLDLVFNRPDADPIVFPFAAPVDSGGARVYSSTVPAGPTLRLTLEEVRCQDGMSGFWFPFRAEVSIDGETMTGCAAEGW